MAAKKKLSPAMRKLVARRAKAGSPKAQEKLAARRRKPAALEDLEAKWVAERDCTKAHRLLNRIGARAAAEDAEGVRALVRYCRSGPLDPVRQTAASRLSDVVAPSDLQVAAEIRLLLEDPVTAWGLARALLRIEGSGAWSALAALARVETLAPWLIGEILQLVCEDSGQPLLANCPTNPRDWTRDSIPLSALASWEAEGFPQGDGPRRLPRDPGLDDPRSPLERLAARLDRNLEKASRRAEGPA
ncbi:MAG: hypothetical protein R3F62_21305 [Planctomycetota bacterium]